MNLSLFHAVLAILYLAVRPESDCGNTRTYFDGMLEPSGLFSTPLRIGGTCGSDSSCCSYSAVDQLKVKAKEDFEEALTSRVNSTSPSCSEMSFRGITRDFINSQKSFIETQVMILFGSYYSAQTAGFFDAMVDSAENYLLADRPLCGLQTLITDTSVDVYLRVLAATYSGVPTTDAFRQCAGNLYLQFHNATLQPLRHHMENSLIRVAYLFEFSRILDSFVQTVLREGVTYQCADLLTKFQYCDGCSGNSEDRDAHVLCKRDCDQAMSECLHSFNAIREVTESWRTYLNQIKQYINNFGPNNMFTQVPFAVLGTVQGVLIQSSPEVLRLQQVCQVSLKHRNVLRKKRSDHSIRPRQAVVDYNLAAMDKVDCITAQINNIHYPLAASHFCSNSTGCSEATNGSVVTPTLVTLAQGELADRLILQSRYILASSFECFQTASCPNFKDYCWVNNLNISKVPAAVREERPVPSSTVVAIPSSSTSDSSLEVAFVPSSTAVLLSSSKRFLLSSPVVVEYSSSAYSTSEIMPSITELSTSVLPQPSLYSLTSSSQTISLSSSSSTIVSSFSSSSIPVEVFSSGSVDLSASSSLQAILSSYILVSSSVDSASSSAVVASSSVLSASPSSSLVSTSIQPTSAVPESSSIRPSDVLTALPLPSPTDPPTEPATPKPPTTGRIPLDPRPWTDVVVDDLSTIDAVTSEPTSSALSATLCTFWLISAQFALFSLLSACNCF